MNFSTRVNSIVLAGMAASACLIATNASALDTNQFTSKFITKVVDSVQSNSSSSMPGAGTIEVAFSPNEGSEALVLKVINSAHSDIRMLAYSFTSAPVVQALLNAKHRGVDIKLVVDKKNNVSEDRSGKARAALSALITAGVDVRTISVYAIHHDKVIIADHQTVELGSFNFSDAAAHKNSENVLVNWNNPSLAKVYANHFERNYRQSSQYQTRY